MATRRKPALQDADISARPTTAVEAELARRRKAGYIPFTELGEALERLNGASVIGMHPNTAGDIVLVVQMPAGSPAHG